jgi:uncharacterized repeat protein (TIGR03803 family)
MTKTPRRLHRTAALAALFVLAIATPPAQAQTATETVLYTFTANFPKGTNPTSGVIRDAAGNLYGTAAGGAFDAGIVYKIDATGHLKVLYTFTGGPDGGGPFEGGPSGDLTFDSAGNLYGTTAGGGTAGVGVVFRLDPAGHETVLYTFTLGDDGNTPLGGVILDPAGNLYGTTKWGGASYCAFGCGTVYKVDSTGHQTVLYNFTGEADGSNPYAGLARDAAGNLYGTTYTGGRYWGVVFKLATSGQESVLYTFTDGTDGSRPEAPLVLDSAGNVYGTTYTSGKGQGVVFKVDPAGHETVLHLFTGGTDGAHPQCGVIRDSAGNLFGTTPDGGTAHGGVVYKITAGGQEQILYTFVAGAGGNTPSVGLTRDSAGNLYGTAPYGGATVNAGVVYKLDTAGQETVLYTFTGSGHGSNPVSGVVRDPAGNLYGTTYYGGSENAGVVYKVDTAGHSTVLHNFTGGADGANPQAGVVLDAAGNLYGTTAFGGNACPNARYYTVGCGAVYKVDMAGHVTVLYTFTGEADGGNPLAGVIRDSEGNLYGTTGGGGASNVGVVYKLDPTGQETVLYDFLGGAGGGQPGTGVVRDSAGNFYGTAGGGATGDWGVVYKLDTAGNQTVLHTFTAGADGSYPNGLTLDSAGNLYGTTENGAAGFGVVFEIDTTGNLAVLYTFTGGADGSNPQAGVTRNSAGSIYGTTSNGGAADAGVVYELDSSGQETVLYSFTGGADGGEPYAAIILGSDGNLYGTTRGGGHAGCTNGPGLDCGVLYTIKP